MRIDVRVSRGHSAGAATVASGLLDVISSDILALTERGVAGGHKVFGAATLAEAADHRSRLPQQP